MNNLLPIDLRVETCDIVDVFSSFTCDINETMTLFSDMPVNYKRLSDEVIEGMLKTDPEERLTAEEVVIRLRQLILNEVSH